MKIFSKPGDSPTSAPGSPNHGRSAEGKGDEKGAGGGERKSEGLGEAGGISGRAGRNEGDGVPFAGKAFSFYHGEFQEGSRSGEPGSGIGDLGGISNVSTVVCVAPGGHYCGMDELFKDSPLCMLASS